jgi:hypothetical protein
MSNPHANQLAEIRKHIREWHEDAAESQRRAAKCQRMLDEHLAEAAAATEMAQRWEVVHDAIRFGVVPNLDGCLGPETGEVAW